MGYLEDAIAKAGGFKDLALPLAAPRGGALHSSTGFWYGYGDLNSPYLGKIRVLGPTLAGRTMFTRAASSHPPHPWKIEPGTRDTSMYYDPETGTNALWVMCTSEKLVDAVLGTAADFALLRTDPGGAAGVFWLSFWKTTGDAGEAKAVSTEERLAGDELHRAEGFKRRFSILSEDFRRAWSVRWGTPVEHDVLDEVKEDVKDAARDALAAAKKPLEWAKYALLAAAAVGGLVLARKARK